jgi:hypothetical protein
LFFENALQAAAFLVTRRVWFVTTVAVLIVEAAAGGLLRAQIQLGVALPALNLAAAEDAKQDADDDGNPRAVISFIVNQRVDQMRFIPRNRRG